MSTNEQVMSAAQAFADRIAEYVTASLQDQLQKLVKEAMAKPILTREEIVEIVENEIETFKDSASFDLAVESVIDNYKLDDAIESALDSFDFNEKMKEWFDEQTFTVSRN